MNNLFLSLLQNGILLLALTYSYGLIKVYFPQKSSLNSVMAEGVVFGFFAILNMQLLINLAPGIVFDLRSVMIALAAISGGAIPTLIAAAMVGVYRLLLGGAGAIYGFEGAFAAALCGYTFYRLHHKANLKLNLFTWVLLGITLWANAIMSIHFVPEVGQEVSRRIVLPLLPAYLISTVILGELLIYQRKIQELQTQLSLSEKRFREIFDTQYQFIGLMTPQGVLIEANRTALSFAGLTLDEVIGKPFWEARWWQISPAAQQRLKEAITEAAQGKFIRYDVEVRGKGETTIIIDFSIKPVFNEYGQVDLLIPEGRDITHQKQLEQKAIQLASEKEHNKMLHHMLKDVSHDLRTPMTILISSAYLSARTTDPEKRKQQLEKMETQAQHIKTLMDDLFDAVRLEEEKHLSIKLVNISTLIKSIIDLHQPLMDAKHLTCEYHLDESVSIAPANEVEIRRAITHVLVNAITYTFEYGAITVFTKKEGNNLLIALQDSGIGISAADLPYVFDHFYRADKSRSTTTGGTGLGLSIAKRIIEGHKGTINIESELGSGTTVKIYLPL